MDEEKLREREVVSGETSEQEQEQAEDRIGEAEIRKAVKKMKMKKAMGIDSIPTKAWKYAGEGYGTGWWNC